MLSGGLDSILAGRLMQERGTILQGVHVSTPFEKDLDLPTRAAEYLGIPVEFLKIEEEYIEIVRQPAHGYGSNLNPCIDCRIMMLKLAREQMQRTGASFIVTGEVVGERPMTQNRNSIRMIEKCAGLDGLIVRPLTAKILTPSVPELKGVVDRDSLLGLSGRGRKPQLKLADTFGLTEIPTPAGGCSLTDPCFSKRVKDLLEHDELTLEDVKLLHDGRHFRLPSGAKVVVGRNQSDNAALLRDCLQGDYVFTVRDGKGPTVVLRSEALEDIKIAASLCARYAKKFESVDVVYGRKSDGACNSVLAEPASGHLYTRYMI